MRTIEVVSDEAPMRERISIGPHALVSDEPVDAGGGDAGPQPHELLLAALGACTATTLRMYARRKQWPLEAVRVRVRATRDGGAFAIKRRIEVDGELSDEQRAALKVIAEKCPVHRTLTGQIRITTTVHVAADKVLEADEESFPASDAPAWTLGDDED